MCDVPFCALTKAMCEDGNIEKSVFDRARTSARRVIITLQRMMAISDSMDSCSVEACQAIVNLDIILSREPLPLIASPPSPSLVSSGDSWRVDSMDYDSRGESEGEEDAEVLGPMMEEVELLYVSRAVTPLADEHSSRSLSDEGDRSESDPSISEWIRPSSYRAIDERGFRDPDTYSTEEQTALSLFYYTYGHMFVPFLLSHCVPIEPSLLDVKSDLRREIRWPNVSRRHSFTVNRGEGHSPSMMGTLLDAQARRGKPLFSPMLIPLPSWIVAMTMVIMNLNQRRREEGMEWLTSEEVERVIAISKEPYTPPPSPQFQ